MVCMQSVFKTSHKFIKYDKYNPSDITTKRTDYQSLSPTFLRDFPFQYCHPKIVQLILFVGNL